MDRRVSCRGRALPQVEVIRDGGSPQAPEPAARKADDLAPPQDMRRTTVARPCLERAGDRVRRASALAKPLVDEPPQIAKQPS